MNAWLPVGNRKPVASRELPHAAGIARGGVAGRAVGVNRFPTADRGNAYYWAATESPWTLVGRTWMNRRDANGSAACCRPICVLLRLDPVWHEP